MDRKVTIYRSIEVNERSNPWGTHTELGEATSLPYLHVASCWIKTKTVDHFTDHSCSFHSSLPKRSWRRTSSAFFARLQLINTMASTATKSGGRTPSHFLKAVIGRPVVVMLNSHTEYRGVLVCLDGYMNIALEQTEEYVNGELKHKYGDVFIRGNNGTI